MPARSFRLVSFCFEVFCLETDSCKVFHCQSEPKDAELRPRLAQEKDRVLRALFFTDSTIGILVAELHKVLRSHSEAIALAHPKSKTIEVGVRD